MDPRLPNDGQGDAFLRPPQDRSAHVETGRETRQGPLGRPILYVLVGGLALAAVYLIGTQIWSNSADLPPANQVEGGETPTPPAGLNTTAPGVTLPTNTAPVAPATPMTPAPAPTITGPTPVTPAPVAP